MATSTPTPNTSKPTSRPGSKARKASAARTTAAAPLRNAPPTPLPTVTVDVKPAPLSSASQDTGATAASRPGSATKSAATKRSTAANEDPTTDASKETTSTSKETTSIWDFKSHLATARGLLEDAQSTFKDGKKKLEAVANHKAVRAAREWWKERDTRPADQPDDTRATIKRLEMVAKTFDGIRIPVAGREVALGADLVLNFVPGGQWVSLGAHGYMLYEGIRFGAPFSLLQTMAGRMTVDGMMSGIPVAGVIYDALRLAHSNNARDLSAWLSDQLVLNGESVHAPTSMNPAAALA